MLPKIHRNIYEKLIPLLEKHGFKLGSFIGHGDLGDAYELENASDKVLKITTDHTEAYASNLLIGKQLKHVCHIYRVFRFKEIPDIYMVEQEKLIKNPDSDRIRNLMTDHDLGILYEKLTSQTLKYFEQHKVHFNKMYSEYTNLFKKEKGYDYDKSDLKKLSDNKDIYINILSAYASVKILNDVYIVDAFDTLLMYPFKVVKGASELIEGLYELYENGIYYHDFTANNILMDTNGNLKIIDIGFSKSKNSNLEILESMHGIRFDKIRDEVKKQLKKYGYSLEKEPLGFRRGFNSEIYKIKGKDRVLKITPREDEAKVSAKLIGKNLKNVVHIYRVFQLSKHTKYYFIEMELLEYSDILGKLDKSISDFNVNDEHLSDIFNKKILSEKELCDIFNEYYKIHNIGLWDTKITKIPKVILDNQKLILDYINGQSELNRLNIDHGDLSIAFNTLLKNGVLKIIDFGLSSGGKKGKVPILGEEFNNLKSRTEKISSEKYIRINDIIQKLFDSNRIQYLTTYKSKVNNQVMTIGDEFEVTNYHVNDMTFRIWVPSKNRYFIADYEDIFRMLGIRGANKLKINEGRNLETSKNLISLLSKHGYELGFQYKTGVIGDTYSLKNKKDRVLKITMDKNEATICAKLIGKNFKHVVHIYRVFQFKSEPDFYIIEMEKLKKVPETSTKYIDKYKDDFHKGLKELDSIGVINLVDRDIYLNKYLVIVAHNCMLRGNDLVLIDFGQSRLSNDYKGTKTQTIDEETDLEMLYHDDFLPSFIKNLKKYGYDVYKKINLSNINTEGNVYTLKNNPQRVIKITANKTDALSSTKLIGKKFKNVIHIYRVFQLKNYPKLYVIEMEKLNEIKTIKDSYYSDIDNGMKELESIGIFQYDIILNNSNAHNIMLRPNTDIAVIIDFGYIIKHKHFKKGIKRINSLKEGRNLLRNVEYEAKIKDKLKAHGYILGKQYREGTSSDVYALKNRPNNVLKITQYKIEAEIALKLKRYAYTHLVKVFRVFQLKDFNEVYFIEMEKLKPIPNELTKKQIKKYEDDLLKAKKDLNQAGIIEDDPDRYFNKIYNNYCGWPRHHNLMLRGNDIVLIDFGLYSNLTPNSKRDIGTMNVYEDKIDILEKLM